VKNIPYSEFVKLVKEGKVSEIAISENDIQGRMLPSDDGKKANTLFRTVRVDPGISSCWKRTMSPIPEGSNRISWAPSCPG
jgi:cell division protease FtsH